MNDAIRGEPRLAADSRWRLVALLLAMVATAHFNRISMSVAGAGAIIPKEGVDPTHMGMVYSAYLLLYTFAMSPGGWFNDHFGPRLGLFVVGAGSAVFVTLTGLAGCLWTGTTLLLGLLAIRGLMGIFNAPTHPGAARLVGNWIPGGQRSLVNGMVNFAACVGISTTYLLFGFLMDHFEWTGASFIAGGATFVLALVWIVFATNRPVEPGFQTEFGNQNTRTEFGNYSDISVPARPVLELLLNRSLVFLTLSYAALGYFQYLFFYWAEYYFEQVRHLTKQESRMYTSILTLAMGLGMVAGGWLTDWTRTRFHHRRAIALVPVTGLILSAVLLLTGLFSEAPMLTLLFFTFAMAAAGASEGAFWTLAVEIGDSRGGLAAGILNTGGNAGGLIAPVLTPYVSAWLGWQAGLGLASVACFIGAMCWIWIDPDEGRGERQRFD
jgi:sugar phosphate permease